MKLFNLSLVSLSLAATLTSSFAANIDQRTNDTTVLQAWLGTTMSPAPEEGMNLKMALCGPVQKGTNTGLGMYMGDYQDCTAAVQASLKNSSDSTSPAIATDFNYGTNTAFCQTYEIRTVTKLSSLNSPIFEGIGFVFQDAFVNQQQITGDGNRGVFIPKAQLDQVGQQVTLKDGELAVVHRFVAKGACMDNGDDGYGIEFSTVMFRPYARFNDGTNQYTNWDSVSSDYVLGVVQSNQYPGEAPHVEKFDRQTDVLK